MMWIPWTLYLVTALLFGWSVLRDAPAIALSIQGFIGAGVIQVMLAIYSEVLELRRELALARGSETHRGTEPEVGRAQAAD